MHKKKGGKKAKPEKQFQPNYVADAKKEAEARRRERSKLRKEELDNLKAFWQVKNPKARIIK